MIYTLFPIVGLLKFVKFFIIFLVFNLFVISNYSVFYNQNVFTNTYDIYLKKNLKSILTTLVLLTSWLVMFFVMLLNTIYYQNYRQWNNKFMAKIYIVFIDFNNESSNNLLLFTLNKFNIIFITLFALLFPVIFLMISNDHNNINLKKQVYMYVIFILCYLILFVENLILFYFIYELILILVYYCMYQTSNSRGAVEATLYFAGWAVLGSILVGLGLLILIILTNYSYFFQLKFNKLTSSESYWIYLLFFFGFGIKLSIWPFWYWLPKAHVEVSTGMSIFLSCVLIKLSFFSLVRFQSILLSENNMFICIFFCFMSCLDIVLRFGSLKDLKAIIAYSSVLHTNLLIVLIHLDSSKIFKASIYYVWGHSLATASLFIIVYLIETRYGSRSTLNVTGLCYNSPILFILSLISVISFLDIPITVFFWGEIWLWTVSYNRFFLLTLQALFLVNVIFTSFFFKVWLCIFFGTSDLSSKKISNTPYNQEIIETIIYLVFFQLLLGVQPSVLSYISTF